MHKTSSQDKLIEQLQKILHSRGEKALKLAREKVLEENLESKKVKEALTYFMNEYWHDVTRPALLSIVCEAVGGDPNITFPVSIPMSLISGAIDIHDDIIDQSTSKWSRPTVYGKFGKNVALLVGDALLFKGFTLLHEAINNEIPADKILAISKIIKTTFFELGDAEALELQFRGRSNISSENYTRVVKMKAADVEAHMRIASILGNGTKKEIEALSAYGRLLGMLIILNDDLTDMLCFDEFQNRVMNDHLPLQVFYALEKSKDKSEIESILGKTIKTKSDVEKIINFTNNAEGPIFVAEMMKRFADKSISHLENIKKNKNILELLVKTLIPLIVDN
ncbi:MAG: polyprenyl synthetase family protein [Candidatus Bathyarchaeota archaeon]